jgi:DNA (cytosine-5)-methyltransferase 1
VKPSKKNIKTVESILSKNGKYQFTPLKTKKRAQKTLERAQRGIDALGTQTSFLMVYYGTDYAGGWQRLDTPLRTVTTLDRFALVQPDGKGGHEMRMLQPDELQKAMGFPRQYKLLQGTRREKIHLLGNAVCPPVMKAIVQSLTGSNKKG